MLELLVGGWEGGDSGRGDSGRQDSNLRFLGSRPRLFTENWTLISELLLQPNNSLP